MKHADLALLADIGGSNARFTALEPTGAIAEPVVLETAEYTDFAAALEAYRRETGFSGAFGAAAVGVAGPVSEGRARLTNCAWELSTTTIGKAIGGGEAVLVNDFTAVALALPALGESELRLLGGGDPAPGAARAVLGPGTGLGVSGLVPDGRGGFAAIEGEGGHRDLAASNDRELAILGTLIERFGHVSAERVLSGPGLRTLYETLSTMDGATTAETPAPEAIAELAATGQSPIAVQTVALFTRWLGAVAGDLALTLGARGGVYVAGGIVGRWGESLDAALFRQGFEAKGRFEDYLSPIPTWLITAPYPAFKGLASLV